jgi:hypothetical protein
LIVYSRVVFGTWLPAAGYASDGFVGRLVGASPLLTLRWVAEALLDPRRGLLFVTPVLVVLLPWLGVAWRTAPSWVRHAAVGGVVYLSLQLRMARPSGGIGFAGYRTALEAVLLLTPLCLVAYLEAVRHRPVWRAACWVAVGIGIVVTAHGALGGVLPGHLDAWWDRQLQLVERGVDPLMPRGD